MPGSVFDLPRNVSRIGYGKKNMPALTLLKRAHPVDEKWIGKIRAFS